MKEKKTLFISCENFQNPEFGNEKILNVAISRSVETSEEKLLLILLKYYNLSKYTIIKSSNSIINIDHDHGFENIIYLYRLSIIVIDKHKIDHIHNGNLLAEKILTTQATIRPKIGFLFTGQGSQYVGMGQSLYNFSPIFKTAFDTCLAYLCNNVPVDLKEVLWGENTILLNESLYSQTTIFCLEYALVQLWKHYGVEPDYVLGPSAGGFCAAVASGALNLEDGVRLVTERGKLIQALPTGGMTSVRATVPQVQKIIDSLIVEDENAEENWLDIAVINSPDDIVVAGRLPSLEIFEKYCKEYGIKNLRLAAGQAFHSREISGIFNDYEQVLSQISPNEPNCAYVTGTNGTIFKNAEDFSSKYWQSHAREPVDFPAAISTLYDEGVRIFIEIGPQPTLLTVGKHNLGPQKVDNSTWLPSLRKNENNWTTFMNNLGTLHAVGLKINLND